MNWTEPTGSSNFHHGHGETMKLLACRSRKMKYLNRTTVLALNSVLKAMKLLVPSFTLLTRQVDFT